MRPEVLEHGGHLVVGDRHDDSLTPVQVGQGLESVDDVGPGSQRPGDHGAGARHRVDPDRTDRHEHEGRGAVQGHARHATDPARCCSLWGNVDQLVDVPHGLAGNDVGRAPVVAHRRRTGAAIPSDREDTTMTSTTDTSTTTETSGAQKVAFLVAPEGIEQVELTGPWEAVEQSGATPVLISTEEGTVQAYNHLDKGDTFDVDLTVGSADVADYAALVLPGGVANQHPRFARRQKSGQVYRCCCFANAAFLISNGINKCGPFGHIIYH